jgi:hypothetical protein
MGLVARLFRGMRDMLIGQFGQEAADKALPPETVNALAEQAAMDMAREVATPSPAYGEPPKEKKDVTTQNAGGAPSAREAELEAENARLRQQTAAFAEAEAGRRRADDAAFLDGLQRDGRLLPANRALAAGLLDRLAGGEAVAFAEGRQAETPRDALRALLAAQPKAVHFGELAGGDAPPDGGDDAHAIAMRAQRLQDEQAKAGRSISFAEAVSRVSGTKAE